MADIAPLVPNEFSRYTELFACGGFFHLSKQITAQQILNVINDFNPKLVNCYEMVRTKPFDFLSPLKTQKHDKEY